MQIPQHSADIRREHGSHAMRSVHAKRHGVLEGEMPRGFAMKVNGVRGDQLCG